MLITLQTLHVSVPGSKERVFETVFGFLAVKKNRRRDTKTANRLVGKQLESATDFIGVRVGGVSDT